MSKIGIIDLFAGPGGLGEGFSRYSVSKSNPFKIAISIEKNEFAHKTLTLRSFCRQFNKAPSEYYQYLQGKISIEDLYVKFPHEVSLANRESCLVELGSDQFPHDKVMQTIDKQLDSHFDKNELVVIGGPPCQAYSLIGRSKMSKTAGFKSDPRHTLYLEYLRIIADVKPLVFVMENVKGMLSSKLAGEPIYNKILSDLKNPNRAIGKETKRKLKKNTYTIYSLVSKKGPENLSKNDFIIKSEDYGIPQARHRVIMIAVRNDCNLIPKTLSPSPSKVSVKQTISDLPKLRSGLSKTVDTYENWSRAIRTYHYDAKLWKTLGRGSKFVPSTKEPSIYKTWYHDNNIGGAIDHESRSHIRSDLHRYYYIATQAKKLGRSVKLEDLPKDLLPNHKNVEKAIKGKSLFNDRFRVQISTKPATTITSHISKDGHYFIHYDPKQCRSLTVREAARLQTFPDNYKFEGPRTAQYHQVGNAVPPLLAKQIAEVVYDLMKRNRSNS